MDVQKIRNGICRSIFIQLLRRNYNEDSDVDGCGTNVEMLIQIEGKNPLSTELVDALKHTIHEYIDSNAGEWSTDDVVNQACEYLESQGYMCDYIGEDLLIEF